MNWPLLAVAVSVLLAGCASKASPMEGPPQRVREATGLFTGDAQSKRLCGRGRSDRLLDAFCPDAPSVTSLVDLRAVLGIDSNTNDIRSGYAMTGHSTSLASNVVSAINPRVIFLGPHLENIEPLIFAFARGEQSGEVVVRDRRGELQFYLITFAQDCNQSEAGCTPGDLFTEAVESDWRDVNVYGEEDLENTPLDCRVCHQPDGPGTSKFLRMQEIEPPWNHWFWRQSKGGRALIDDYYAAKADEPFAGIPGAAIVTAQPGLLSAALFTSGSQVQPNAYISTRIEQEVIDSAATLGGEQPMDNSVPGKSASWDAIYNRAKRGEAISVPYHDVKVTAPEKLARLSEAYAKYRAGTLPREELPDLSDIYPDDPMLRAQIGLETEPGLDGDDVLLQACAQCHNSRLDPTVSRARFGLDLAKLDRREKEQAILRVTLPRDHSLAMPPRLARQLSEEGRSRLIELLQR